MSEFFVKTFNKQHKCPGCKNAKLVIGNKVYSLCELHLTKAREHWSNWAKVRREEGLCSYCHCKSLNGWLRCRKHTMINRARIKAWMEKHPEYSREGYEKRLDYLIQGYCPSCREHRKLPNGFKRCKSCRIRQRGYTYDV